MNALLATASDAPSSSSDGRKAWQDLCKALDALLGSDFVTSLPFTPQRLQRLSASTDFPSIGVQQIRDETYGATLTGSHAKPPHPLASPSPSVLHAAFARLNSAPLSNPVASVYGPSIASNHMDSVLAVLDIVWIKPSASTATTTTVISVVGAMTMGNPITYQDVWTPELLKETLTTTSIPTQSFIPAMGIIGSFSRAFSPTTSDCVQTVVMLAVVE